MSCFQTNPETCSQCMPGFYLTTEGKCSACPSFCGTCFNATFCTSESNSIGSTVVTSNGTSSLVVCDQGCMTCQEVNPVSCSVCLPGYVMVPSTDVIVSHCVPCSTNCRTCVDSSNTTSCTSCFSGYFLSTNNTCVTCENGCLSCPSSSLLSTCQSCPANMVLFNNNTCADISGSQQECGTLCSACTQHPNNSYTCDICAPGAVLKSGVCVSCPEHCAQCSVSELGVCTSCLPGYYFVASSTSCSPCNQTNCISCNELACLSCASGYMLSPTLQCMRTCMSPCATCS